MYPASGPADWAFDISNPLPRPRLSQQIEYGVNRVLSEEHRMTPCGYDAEYKPPESSFDGLTHETPLEDESILNTFSVIVYGVSGATAQNALLEINELLKRSASDVGAPVWAKGEAREGKRQGWICTGFDNRWHARVIRDKPSYGLFAQSIARQALPILTIGDLCPFYRDYCTLLQWELAHIRSIYRRGTVISSAKMLQHRRNKNADTAAMVFPGQPSPPVPPAHAMPPPPIQPHSSLGTTQLTPPMQSTDWQGPLPGGAPAGSRPLPNQHDWPAPLAGTVTGRGDENPSGGGSTTLIGEDSRSPVQPAEPETARAAPEYDDEDDLKEDERDDDTVPIVSQVTGGEEDEDALEEPTRNMLDPLPAARKRRRADAEDELVEGADRAAKARRLATREYKRLNVFWEEACLSEETRTTMIPEQKHLISVVRAFNVWYVRHGSRNLFTIDDAGTIRKKAAWTSRSYAEEYTEVQVPEDVLSKIQAPCSNLTYSDAAVIEMLFRDPDHLVEWNRFVTEPLDSIRHLNVWNVPNRKSMLSQTGPALYAFCILQEKPYVGSTEELKIRAPQHVDGIASGKGINRVVTDNYKGREFKDGPEGVVYAPPEQIERTSLYTLESKNISAYGGLVEMGGSNVNLLDRQTYREVVSREELEIGIVKTLDLLAPKNPETGTREVRSDP
ncbi:hypothetical protein RHOSPDRAFT_25728 [Rhodotorula sp. JG-1b]|nr:hypothetical protein RHOSPDRAFT_25728 [Rhodotorula sp. JG-1b]